MQRGKGGEHRAFQAHPRHALPLLYRTLVENLSRRHCEPEQAQVATVRGAEGTVCTLLANNPPVSRCRVSQT